MLKRGLFSLIALTLTIAPSAAQPAKGAAERIKAHVRYLASDSLKGRGTGQPGGDLAADYIARQFAKDRLKPAGDNGTYFQTVPLVGVSTLPTTSLQLQAHPLEMGQDCVVKNESQQPHVAIDAPIVFCGFGITAPEYQWDDYKDVDLHGKVALVFVNEPESDRPDFFKGKELTYYGRWTYKFEETARRGAIATLIIHRTDLASYGWEVVRNSWGAEKSFLKNDGTHKLDAAAWIQEPIARRLLEECGLNLDQLYRDSQLRTFKPTVLAARLKGNLDSQVRSFSSRNVIAVLKGSEKPDQGVLYTAHYDHLGQDLKLAGDNIYHGAVDNATGCAVMLEIARAFSTLTPAPPRSIYFISTTAEEQGLLGAAYLAAHPPLPVGQISLDLNFDMLAPIGEPEELTIGGYERTTFAQGVRDVALEMGFTLRPEAHPEAGLYYRMDHFSLAQQGIPGFSIAEGMKFRGHPAEWGMEQFKEFVAKDYHHPSDRFHPEWNFTGLAAFAKVSYALGVRAAYQPDMVQWLPGDEFEAARLKSLKAR